MRIVALAAVLGLVQSACGVERRLYVTDRSGISVYDIDHGHKLVRKIDVPDSGDYKGICASPQLNRLYVTSHTRDELICIDLGNDQVVWRKKLGKYADSMWTTPDGMRLYLPFRDEIDWKVVDARDGSVLAKIDTERGKRYEVDPIADIGPHNTWINPAGTRVYMEVLTVNYVYVTDAVSNQLLGKIGPFAKGVRPFAVSDDEKYLYANVDGLLGFEVARIADDHKSGKVIQRVETRTPAERVKEVPPPAHKPHSTASHGINVSPDQKEVWVVDGVYGYVYVFDVTAMPPKQTAAVPLFKDAKDRPHPGWITFGINGEYVYPDGGAVIDAKSKQVVARIPTSEKMIEVDFEGGKCVAAGHR